MKNFIIILLCFLNLSCVSSSKYQKLFDENQIIIAKNQKNIERIENLNSLKNFLEEDINKKKIEINDLNYYLKQSNNKNIELEENIKNLNLELIVKKEEINTLNNKIIEINEFIEKNKNSENSENSENIENSEIHKKYLNDLKDEGLNNGNILYIIFVSHIGLDFYWDCFANYFINDTKNIGKSLKELRKTADRRRNDRKKYSNFKITISNLNKCNNYGMETGCSETFFIDTVKTSFSNGNTNLEAEIQIGYNSEYIPTYQPNENFPDGEKVFESYSNTYYEKEFIKKINFENNSTYQLFVDAEKSNCVLYLDINIKIKQKIKKPKYSWNKYKISDIIDIKINAAHFVYPNKIQTINF